MKYYYKIKFKIKNTNNNELKPKLSRNRQKLSHKIKQETAHGT